MEDINPIDLLPINNPQDDPNPPTEYDFYLNVVKPLAKDIIKMEATGIPINLEKVSEVEQVLDNVLNNVTKVLLENPLVIKYLKEKTDKMIQNEYGKADKKKKSWEDFIKPFDRTNTVHRTQIVNYYLTRNHSSIIASDATAMEKWTIKDLKQLNQFMCSDFIDRLINDKDLSPYEDEYIKPAMELLAKMKADIFNKNIEAKKANIKVEETFNPASTKHKQEFFTFLGIESESETKKGNPQFNRDELNKLLQYVNGYIDTKENEDDSSM